MRYVSTLFLRAVILGMGGIVLALFGYLLYGLGHPDADGYRAIMIGVCVSAFPFWYALGQGLKLLGYIDAGTAFSQLSVRALERINYAAIIIGAVYTAGLPALYIRAEYDDAPGVLALGLIILGAAVVVSVIVSVLQKLLQQVIDMKSENDLTV